MLLECRPSCYKTIKLKWGFNLRYAWSCLDFYMTVSSAYRWIWHSEHIWSLLKRENRRRPGTEPWGTPVSIIQLIWRDHKRLVCQEEWLTMSNLSEVKSVDLLFIIFSKTCIIGKCCCCCRVRAVVVEWLGLNPDWFGVNRGIGSLLYLDSCLKMSFSNTLATILIIDIGL